MSDTNDAATQATAVPSHTGEDAQNDVLLDVQHLTKRFAAETNFFGRATSHVQAVDDVSFQIRRGEAFGLVGESGCGKTTVGKMLVNLLKPTSGTIVFDGHDLTAMKNKERKRYCRDIQLIFQDPYASAEPAHDAWATSSPEPILTNKLLPTKTKWKTASTSCWNAWAWPTTCATATRTSSPAASASASASPAPWPWSPSSSCATSPCRALDVSIQAQVLNLLDRAEGAVRPHVSVHRPRP